MSGSGGQQQQQQGVKWDSLRSHNGCLSLFDVRDLTQQIRALSMKHEQERASGSGLGASEDGSSVRPRQYRFRRVTPMELLRQQEERRRQQQQEGGGEEAGAPSSSARRVLLPAVQTEDEVEVGADFAAFLEVCDT